MINNFRHSNHPHKQESTPLIVGRPYIVSLFEHQEFF